MAAQYNYYHLGSQRGGEGLLGGSENLHHFMDCTWRERKSKSEVERNVEIVCDCFCLYQQDLESLALFLSVWSPSVFS